MNQDWKCKRCKKYLPECANWKNYNLCSRCISVMHIEQNHICVACDESTNATDNLCDDCRVERMARFDKEYMIIMKHKKFIEEAEVDS